MSATVSARESVAEQAAIRPALSVSLSKAIIDSRESGLANDPVWSALLHVDKGRANIQDAAFLLSSPDFSLQGELEATLIQLYVANPSQLCRFPARYLWLQQRLNLPELALDSCPELSEFSQLAPAEKIDLVFASENLAQAASMMGHVFLKLSGTRPDGHAVEHAISFYTDAGTINLPKLFFDSMVIGKTGYFTLSPYHEKLQQYLRDEQRTIWEYELRLDAQQRRLIQAHLLELKQAKLIYFFQNYNCATVVDFIVALARKEGLEQQGFWLTPKDVVKRAYAAQLVESSKLISPPRWLARVLSDQLSSQDVLEVKNWVVHESLPEPALSAEKNTRDYLKLELAKAFQAYRLDTGMVTTSSAKNYQANLNTYVRSQFPERQLSVDQSTNPVETPQDSQMELGMVRQHGANYVKLGLTPASHHLEDDNRHYLGESELLLFDLSVLKKLEGRELSLDRFVIYGTKSLLPYDALTGGWSGAIRLGMETQDSKRMSPQKMMFVEGGVGVTKRYLSDLDAYALMNAGLGAQGGYGQIYVQPEFGVILREVYDMKTAFSASYRHAIVGNADASVHYRLTQSKFLASQLSLHVRIDSNKSGRVWHHAFEMSVKKVF
ncbi:MAG: DUF4105 domain-containing protein [Burkholderiales bacterium]|nr:DUF4105 domain-containing protein [Burkholderiales bacterium]